MSERKAIIIAAGGTGGHMAPADAVAGVLKARGHKVHLITDSRGAAYTNMLAGVPRTILSATSHTGAGLVSKVRSAFAMVRSTYEARRALKREGARILVGFGGYPSAPAVWAARALHVPYVLHEQNAVMGRVNAFMAKGARALALSYDKTMGIPQGAGPRVFTGNPVREAAVKAGRDTVLDHLTEGQIPEAPTILVVGGSQGARILSDTVPEAVASLPEVLRSRVRLVQQARPEDVERVRAYYKEHGIAARVESYFDDVPALIASSHLVVARAGASTIAEIMAVGCPSVLVPLKIAAQNHQVANARALAALGAADVIEEDALTPASLSAAISAWLSDPERLFGGHRILKDHESSRDAERLADLIEEKAEFIL